MHQIWAQFDHEEQADAVDFLHSLWSYSSSSFFAGRFFHRSERGHTEEREHFPLNLIFPDGEGPISLDSLVNLWVDEGRGQFLYGSPGGVVLNLQRSTLQHGIWTKHHRELDLPTKITLPFSEDGVNVHMANYQGSSSIKEHLMKMDTTKLYWPLTTSTGWLTTGPIPLRWPTLAFNNAKRSLRSGW